MNNWYPEPFLEWQTAQYDEIRERSTDTVNKKSGYALILNHEYFKNNQNRLGTIKDVEALKSVFNDYGIETNVQHDLKIKQIKNLVTNLATQNFSHYKCFILVILTHGLQNDRFSAYDGEYNFISVIEDPLLSTNKSLQEMPKFFIMGVCRGNIRMNVIETDSVSENRPLERQTRVTKRNLLKCNATYEGYAAFRNTTEGSIFIQTFCQILKQYRQYNILKVMEKVIEVVSNDPEWPQVPSILSTMTFSFCFGDLLK